MFVGRRIVYLPAFTPEAWVDAAAAESITHAMVVPTMLGRVLDVLEQTGERLPALRHLSYGGGRMPVEVIERALALLPRRGLRQRLRADRDQLDDLRARRPTTTARPSPATTRPCAAGSARSAGRTAPSRCRSATRRQRGRAGRVRRDLGAWRPGVGRVRRQGRRATDGWFPTNDGGWIDEGGYLFVKGRLDDVIVRGGENISPGEIEDVLRTYPGRRRRRRRRRAVAGVGRGRSWPFVVTERPGARRAGACRPTCASGCARRRSRARVEFRDELPYNETGKLLRRILKAEAAPL